MTVTFYLYKRLVARYIEASIYETLCINLFMFVPQTLTKNYINSYKVNHVIYLLKMKQRTMRRATLSTLYRIDELFKTIKITSYDRQYAINYVLRKIAVLLILLLVRHRTENKPKHLTAY